MSKLDLGHISRLLEANGIKLEHWEEPRQGMINQTLIINHSYVLRADGLQPDSLPSRYLGEVRAYDRLRTIGVPVPEIIALDVSRALVPLPYILMRRLPGRSMAFAWKDMTDKQRSAAAVQAGEVLAQIHGIIMDNFGWLSNLDIDPMASAVEFTDTHFYWHLQEAYLDRAFDSANRARLVALWERVKSYVAQVRQPHLIHGDFQFENILVDDGRIAGVIDFEWGGAGDPAWDFMMEGRWEEQCPGSVKHLYAGYQSTRPLPAHLPILGPFYRLLMHLDNMTYQSGTAMMNQRAISRTAMMEMIDVMEKMEF
jgi:aminoglycoside phosphotransferase (APT) family kinase protein